MDRRPIEPLWPYGTVAWFIINDKLPEKPIEIRQLQIHKVKRTSDGWKLWVGTDPKHPLVFRVDEKGESADIVPWDRAMEEEASRPKEPSARDRARMQKEREAEEERVASEVHRLTRLIDMNPRPSVVPDEETSRRIRAKQRQEWADSMPIIELRQYVQKKREELAEAERLLEKAEDARGVKRHEL